MADRFVSGGTMVPPGEDSPQGVDAATANPARPFLAAGKDTSIEWAAVQKELEEARRTKAVAVRGEERSLYDVLQANKAAKQAAFEEQTKIRNQFRPLDDDEIEFLDEVKAAKRMEEERVRRETEEGLRAFREQQRRTSGGGAAGVNAEGDEVEDAGARAGAGVGEMQSAGARTGEWGAGRKRKRGRERERIGLVKRKVGGAGEEARDKASKETQDTKEADGAKNIGGAKDTGTTKDAEDTRQNKGGKDIKEARGIKETNEAKMTKDTTGSKESMETGRGDGKARSSREEVPTAEEKNGAQNGQMVIAKDEVRETQKEDTVPAGQAATGSVEGGGGMGSKQKSLLVSYGSDDSDDE
ncbi:hypothetical protein E4U17_004812 [Claviceps sp. LM77 group G4]|nr:hypothetical protein E4U17_004812 [Claviceps sp. LM77 group G4]KAG6067619.1 hypothetical protein E4U33_005244 [Claviceps sp. LM78 group G4]KAG6074975.1 hypothetical protein E4U16_003648 [Claviceps sp. LM84 group G4]